MSNISVWSKLMIEIGDNVKIGADTLIIDSDMHALDYVNRRTPKEDVFHAQKKAITIGNDVFIGSRSIICKGVKIGNRAIVGAGSVVTCDIPDDEIWAGNPANFVRKINA